jgi:hypothetical protein
VNRSVPAALFAASLLLAACGGGGGGSSSLPGGGGGTTSTPCPSGWTGTAPNCVAPSSTTAQGTLVDDPSGTPLAGVTVRLDPWIVYPTPGPTPTPIATTTSDPSGHFTISAKNGTYLLVIGSDSNTDTRPTIHDKIVLNGQSVLTAPTMPPLPGVTPPAVETSGNYRLATIDQMKELPCIQAYDSQRTAHSLPLPVVDEWLTENVRAAETQSQSPYLGQAYPSNPFGYLTTANTRQQGGSDCKGMIDAAFQQSFSYAFNAAALWFAGVYFPYQGGAFSAYGVAEFPYDPRVYTDPSAISWP